MRIVIDMQGAQTTGSRNRGIGRYTLALSKAMVRLRGEHEVILVLNGLFVESIEPIRAAFAHIITDDQIRVWDAPRSVNGSTEANDERRHAAELLREAFIGSLKPDIVLLTSLFEGLVDDAVTSVGCFSTEIPSAVILYDLIPLINHEIYLSSPVVERWYLNKLDHLRRTDLLLSISASSGHEAIDYLGFYSENVVNISTACDSHFVPLDMAPGERAAIQNRYGLTRPFIMYTGGIDHRKNIEGLIRAYAMLPSEIRAAHQLAVVCSVQESERERLHGLARDHQLADGEVVFTGFVSESDLVALYNMCKLFVFPSWHEGFGLPALEAMACHRPVIGANTSSVPEVIGLEEALFDPRSDEAIASKIEQAITDDAFRAKLGQHGARQAQEFSWEKTARRALDALEAYVSQHPRKGETVGVGAMQRRPRLAYISPLPPDRSGISDYSAELLPALAKYYDIEVIVAADEVSDPWIKANCQIREVAWFRQHPDHFERVMYHFGNSPYHSHMFELLAEIPGVVVLHDFFLSHVIGHLDYLQLTQNGWARELLHSHGWAALYSRYQGEAGDDAVWAYPCNLNIIQQAQGVIVHSDYSRRLARQCYGAMAGDDWAVIPLVRAPATRLSRAEARRSLALKEEDFIVCSFGQLGPNKLNHRLLAAWLASPMASDPACRLVFVGENHDGGYGAELVNLINASNATTVQITGWVDSEHYHKWLVAADIGVQLRALSRGETSAAVLDCMNYGLATVVNANGSMADLSTDATWILPDEFSDEQLIDALTALWQDGERRTRVGTRAREVIREHHIPASCAEQYARATEQFYRSAALGLPGLTARLANNDIMAADEDRTDIAKALASNFPPKPRRRQLLLDVSALVQRDSKSGIQRVVRALLREYLLNPPVGWAVEPVFSTADFTGFRYARRFTSQFLGLPEDHDGDNPVEVWEGDVLVGLDLQYFVAQPDQTELLLGWRGMGVKIYFVIYDLLPVLYPQYFPDGTSSGHQRWLEAISRFDGAVCISRAVGDELYDWLGCFGRERQAPFELHWFHLGADIENSVPTVGLAEDADTVFEALGARASFLMVGTIEPRKGHAQAFAAFEQLWDEGIDANLVIVGKQGWKIDWLIEKFQGHPEFGKRLIWLEGVSDEYLEQVYRASDCLIAASEGEGFGLPLIEAAQFGLPILARDIPVFREVAENHAQFFPDTRIPETLAAAIKHWLVVHETTGANVESVGMPWLTWKDSARQLFGAVAGGPPYRAWLPDGALRYWGSDHRLETQVGTRDGKAICTSGQSGLLVYGPYVALPVGAYRIALGGRATRWTGLEWIDVVINQGETQILHDGLSAMESGQWNYEGRFSLDAPVNHLELRVWVENETDIEIYGVEVAEDKAVNTQRAVNAGA